MGCLSCAYICPTNYIKYIDKGKTRTIWGKKFKLLSCAKTGRTTITEDFAEYLQKHRGIPADYFKVNDTEHRKELALKMGEIVQWGKED